VLILIYKNKKYIKMITDKEKMEKEAIQELIDKGIVFKEISKILGISYISIRRKCNKYGIKSKFYEIKRKEVKCLNCDTEIKTTIKENKKFCSHSCSAIFNNGLRKVEKKKCLNCDKEINKKRIFCSYRCQRISEINKKVLENTASFRTIKKYLILKHGEKCMECGWCRVNPVSGKVPIELEHIDGNSDNNNLENLKLLCPNCHSLTPTYKALNVGNGRHKRRKRYEENKSY
jgi:predicted nucleic acid-binding Zn ribbon protein